MATIVRDVLLRDGTSLRLRSPTPEDVEELRAFFDGLSARSRYLRFHGAASTRAAARYYAEADGDTRVALIAGQGGGPGRHAAAEGERLVAVAGYERLREPAAAEVAFAVADDHRGRGTATRMLEQLADHAAARGIVRFDADVLAENRPMIGVLRGAGFEVRRQGRGSALRLSLDIRPSEAVAERIAERDHVAAAASLRPILAPRSVAVVGASSEPGSVGGTILENLVAGGFRGVVTPVNRSGGVVGSIRAAAAIGDLPEPPELAVLAVPAEEVLGLAEEAARAGVRALLVVARGFSDAGEEGRRREDELLDTVRSHGLRLLGPNSLGVVNTAPPVRLNATIGRGRVRAGAVGVSAQSGALGLALLGQAAARGLGISAFASLGNRADVSTNDLLEYWEDDGDVRAVMLYVESFGNPGRFSQISRRVSRRKPILAVKGNKARPLPGRPESAGSHTAGALRGESVVDALFRQAGVLRVESAEALFDAAELLISQPLPEGRRVGVVTNSGGLGTMAADACLTRGLSTPALAEATEQRLRAALPHADRTTNPVDMAIAARPDDYAAALEALLADDGVDAAIALYADLAPGDPDAVLAAIERAAGATAKPLVASVVGPDGRLAGRAAGERSGHVPNFRFVEAGVGALAHAADRRDWLARPLGQRPAVDGLDLDEARSRSAAVLTRAPSGWLATADAERLLAAYGIPFAPTEHCPDAEAAVAAAGRVDGPIVLKADFAPPAHASDIDAVLLGLDGDSAIRAGWAELRRRVAAAGREWREALVQPLAGAGADALVGAVRDPDLGPVVGLGIGGREAALTADVAFRLAPSTDVEVEDLIDSSTGVSALLAGFRGGPALERAALAELIVRFAALLGDAPELVEVDLNPVRLLPEGCLVLDVRARIERRDRPQRVKTW